MLKWSFEPLAIGVLAEDGTTLVPETRIEIVGGALAFMEPVCVLLNAYEARIAELEAEVERLEADAADARSLYSEDY